MRLTSRDLASLKKELHQTRSLVSSEGFERLFKDDKIDRFQLPELKLILRFLKNNKNIREVKLTGKKGELIDRIREVIYSEGDGSSKPNSPIQQTVSTPQPSVQHLPEIIIESIEDMVEWLDKCSTESVRNAFMILYIVTKEVMAAPGFYDLEVHPKDAENWKSSGAYDKFGEPDKFFLKLSEMWINLLTECGEQISDTFIPEDFEEVANGLEESTSVLNAMYGGTFEHRFDRVVRMLRDR
ncbi:altered inheritance of mitochondria protein [Acrasis kona]|uniref:Altered inheritance of mitochondria protein n=1 Tax=Acrasis kona TaxID=1008807 RepID=A0AAW2ZJR5_9EUKA